MENLDNPIFKTELKARKYLESQRWPDGPECPHCGVVNQATALDGEAHRKGLYQCNACREQFSVTVGTLYERSHVPLHTWLLATHLLCAGKKGTSSHQLSRMLGVTYKTARFMSHRIREAMRPVNPGPMGGDGQTVEADETFLGPSPDVFVNPRRGLKAGWRKKPGTSAKMKVLTLVERDGHARSFHIANVKSATLRDVIYRNLKQDTHFMTDDFNAYRTIGKRFASHESVNHSAKEYVRGTAHTNTVEGFFSVFKRGLVGTYQHVSEKHLARYLAEFDFRYNNRTALDVTDGERTAKALKGIGGKRLTYRRTSSGKAA